ncbi:hypothetical protein RHO15_10045 [Utexia brackfieldae]|uniref:hypothetical protein n=1 Tax=Utexia brackfieldae TaxID=3074108 RepID=UPI00370D2581
MIRYDKILFVTIISTWLILFSPVQATTPSVLASVLEKGFPADLKELSQTTEQLYAEYQSSHQILALIFYAYGLLQQADDYQSRNDYVHAAANAKLGFFFLDEAVDLHPDDLRVHYLRARIDAYLPAKLGRCVITLQDTELLHNTKTALSQALAAQINYMRYRALNNCRLPKQAQAWLTQLTPYDAEFSQLLQLKPNRSPAWAMAEIMQIMMPLMKGE